MNSTILDARTVAIVKPFQVEKRQGQNGEFESKSILVRIAVDRDYKVRRTENGKTIEEYPTDFWLCKFTGAVAQVFADHCTALKEDGKLHSRRLLLSGNFENYDKPRKVSKQINVGGALYDIEFEVADNNTIFVVDSMKFLDKNPNANATANGAVVVTPVAQAVATPVAQTQPVAMPIAQVQPVAQPVVATAPVAVSAPAVIEQVAQTMATPVATPVEAVPTVPTNFVPVGETAPF